MNAVRYKAVCVLCLLPVISIVVVLVRIDSYKSSVAVWESAEVTKSFLNHLPQKKARNLIATRENATHLFETRQKANSPPPAMTHLPGPTQQRVRNQTLRLPTTQRIVGNLSAAKQEVPNVQSLNQEAFWMAVSYTGQMTSCLADLLTLQCFASTMDPQVRVVEPFLDTESGLGTHSFHLESGSQESLKLYDLYDKAEWNKVTSSYSPLVSWEHFIQNAPRKLIIVDPHCSGLFPVDCHTEELRKLKILLENRYGFQVVNTVYFRNTGKQFSVSEYKELLYGQYSPRDVVVLFHVWGEADWGKVNFNTAKFQCRHVYRDMPASGRIKNDALKYAQKYMSTDGYISVMIRLEWFYRSYIHDEEMSKVEIISMLLRYYKAIVTKVQYLKRLKNVSSVFLTMDCTEQGSKFFKDQYDGQPWEKKLIASTAKTMFEMIQGKSSSLKDWEDGFYDVASSRNKGYIAQLQKYLAANGTCLVTAGGGTFHKTATELHKQLHPSNACVHTVEY